MHSSALLGARALGAHAALPAVGRVHGPAVPMALPPAPSATQPLCRLLTTPDQCSTSYAIWSPSASWRSGVVCAAKRGGKGRADEATGSSAPAEQARKRGRPRTSPLSAPPPQLEDGHEDAPVAGDAALDALAELGLDGTAGRGRTREALVALPADPLAGDDVGSDDGEGAGGEGEEDGKEEPTDHMDPWVMHKLYKDTEYGWADLPLAVLPRNKRERETFESQMEQEAYFKHMWAMEAVDDLAFWFHHRSRERAHNIYANTRQMAAMIQAYEADDFAMGERSTHYSSWARAEIAFAPEYDAFNEEVGRNIMSMVRQPLQEELREQLESVNEAALLPATEAERSSSARSVWSGADVKDFMVENFLEGVLPGASLYGNEADSYADDIFLAAGGGDADELFNVYEKEYQEEEGEEGEGGAGAGESDASGKAAGPKKRGRKPKASKSADSDAE